MSASEVEKYVLDYLNKNNFTDILDSDFIWGFIRLTNAPHTIQPFGAPKCKRANKLLGSMYKQSILNRVPMGLPVGDSNMGFPKWVYSYGINEKTKG